MAIIKKKILTTQVSELAYRSGSSEHRTVGISFVNSGSAASAVSVFVCTASENVITQEDVAIVSAGSNYSEKPAVIVSGEAVTLPSLSPRFSLTSVTILNAGLAWQAGDIITLPFAGDTPAEFTINSITDPYGIPNSIVINEPGSLTDFSGRYSISQGSGKDLIVDLKFTLTELILVDAGSQPMGDLSIAIEGSQVSIAYKTLITDNESVVASNPVSPGDGFQIKNLDLEPGYSVHATAVGDGVVMQVADSKTFSVVE